MGQCDCFICVKRQKDEKFGWSLKTRMPRDMARRKPRAIQYPPGMEPKPLIWLPSTNWTYFRLI